MTIDRAKNILIRAGASKEQLSSISGLSAFRRSIMKQVHSDVGGNHNQAAEINAAIDTIKHNLETGVHRSVSPSFDDILKPKTEQNVPWAAGSTDTEIRAENYTDLNYLKKHVYYLSEPSGCKIMKVFVFDGRRIVKVFDVYASLSVIHDLVHATVIYNSHGTDPKATVAIIIQRDGELSLIYSDGVIHTTPVPIHGLSPADIMRPTHSHSAPYRPA